MNKKLLLILGIICILFLNGCSYINQFREAPVAQPMIAIVPEEVPEEEILMEEIGVIEETHDCKTINCDSDSTCIDGKCINNNDICTRVAIIDFHLENTKCLFLGHIFDYDCFCYEILEEQTTHHTYSFVTTYQIKDEIRFSLEWDLLDEIY